jgi:hypothetical protein
MHVSCCPSAHIHDSTRYSPGRRRLAWLINILPALFIIQRFIDLPNNNLLCDIDNPTRTDDSTAGVVAPRVDAHPVQQLVLLPLMEMITKFSSWRCCL